MKIGDVDYISLTDLARYADAEEPRLPIRDWMRNKEVISYLGLWESMNNKNFKGGEFDTFKNEDADFPRNHPLQSKSLKTLKNID